MNRKATFAKRQREADLKDHARNKEARRQARKDAPTKGKGPEIAWDEAVHATFDPNDVSNLPPIPGQSLNPTDDSADSSDSSSSSSSGGGGGGGGGGSNDNNSNNPSP